MLQLLFICLFIDKLRSQVLHFLYSPLQTNIWNPKNHEGLEDESPFRFGVIFRWTIWVFQDVFGPVLGLCFSEPLGPGYGTSTVPWVKTLQGAFLLWKIYQSVGFYPNKNHWNPPVSTKNWGCGNTRFLIIQNIENWDIHWSLVFVKMGMRGNSPFNKNRGQMKGAIIWGHETGETSLAIRRFSYLLLDGHIFSWVHPKHLQRIQLSTMKGIDSFWGCFEFQEMKQLLNLDWMKSFSNFHWVFTGSPLKFLGKWTHYTMKQYSNS